MAAPETPSWAPLSDVPPTPVEETLRRGRALISPRAGLMRRLVRGVRHDQDPRLLWVGNEPAELSRYLPIRGYHRSGACGEDLSRILAATLGETVERYSILCAREAQTQLATAAELGELAVPLNLLRLYSREQASSGGLGQPYVFPESDTPLRWAWAHSLSHNQPRMVPAAHLYPSYRPAADEAPIGSMSSTGAAAGATFEEAVLSGLLEILERDTFVTSWLLRYPGRRLRIDDQELESLLRRAFAVGHPEVDLRLYAIDTGLPGTTVLAWLRRPSEFGPVCTVAASTRLSPRLAVTKALYELGQVFFLQRYLSQDAWQPEDDFANVNTFEHHGLLYLRRPELVAEAFAFLEGAAQLDFSEMRQQETRRILGDIQHCVRALAAAGYEVLVAELTSPEIRDLGLRVARVLVPGLVPMHSDHRRPCLGLPRLRSLPQQLSERDPGWNPPTGLQPPAGLNPYPHPFP